MENFKGIGYRYALHLRSPPTFQPHGCAYGDGPSQSHGCDGKRTDLFRHKCDSWSENTSKCKNKQNLTKKGKGSPYSITERKVPDLIPVLGSQPAGDVGHKPINGRLLLGLLSTRPAITPATLKRAATNFAAWWTEARWVWTVCLRLLPDSVATAIWTRAFCAWVQHANHSATEPQCTIVIKRVSF